MPRFIVTERRAYDVRYLIDAATSVDARNLAGEIIEEDGDPMNSWGDELLSIEETTVEELS